MSDEDALNDLKQQWKPFPFWQKKKEIGQDFSQFKRKFTTQFEPGKFFDEQKEFDDLEKEYQRMKKEFEDFKQKSQQSKKQYWSSSQSSYQNKPKQNFQRNQTRPQVQPRPPPPKPQMTMQEFAERWSRFTTNTPVIIKLSDVPWPSGQIAFAYYLGTNNRDKKKAYHKACRDWHPDKFSQKFGQNLCEQERDQIEKSVTRVFQDLQSQFDNAK